MARPGVKWLAQVACFGYFCGGMDNTMLLTCGTESMISIEDED